MTLKNIIKLTLSHLVAVAIGIAIGIYTLPILIAPPAPTDEPEGLLHTRGMAASGLRPLCNICRVHHLSGEIDAALAANKESP